MTLSPSKASRPQHADLVIIGAGAAGLTAAIWAGRTNPNQRIIVLDGAAKLGAKILVSGGARCNVTHDVVDASAYAGSSRNAIAKVLRRFDVPQTVTFFQEIGVDLKREETGKLFPVTDSARTVLNALVNAAYKAGVELHYPCRVTAVQRESDDYVVSGDWGAYQTPRVILATGGKSLPKSGSDGGGYWLAKTLGHTLTSRIFPALVPLTLPNDHFLIGLSGVTFDAAWTVQSSTGKRLFTLRGSTLATHFGLSGPAILDISRYYTDAKLDDEGAALTMSALPDHSPEQVEAELMALGKNTPLRHFNGEMPERLLRALCTHAGIEATTLGAQITREGRKRLTTALTRLPLPIIGDRGYTYAEVTAGGVPLSELKLDTMESRVSSGLYLCGEILDVDGRIGGYNFQWAWASGYVAGVSSSKFKVESSK